MDKPVSDAYRRVTRTALGRTLSLWGDQEREPVDPEAARLLIEYLFGGEFDRELADDDRQQRDNEEKNK